MSVFLRLFNGSLIGLKVLEILIITFSNIVLYKIMRLFWSFKESFFAALLMVMNPYIFMGSGIINNQHISLLLCLLAMYVFLKTKDFVLNRKSILKYGVCGLLLALSQTLRPTATVVLSAFIICSLLYGFFKKDKQVLTGAVITFAVYLISFNLINILFIFSNLAPIGIKNSNLYFKIVLGLTGNGITGIPTTDAEHTQLYYDLQAFNFDYNAYKEAAKEYIKACFLEKKVTLKALFDKMIYFTGSTDNQYSFTNNDFNTDNYFLVGILNVVGTNLYFFSILFSFIRSFCERKTVNNKAYLLWVLIFGLFFFAYIVLEVQPRYRYEQYYVLFFLSMPLLYKTIEKFHNYLLKYKILS